jgi:hypothetical protein
MNHEFGRSAAGICLLLGISGILSPIDAQALFTENLCGPGTTWMSLPSESDIMTAEQLCQAIGPAAMSVAKFYPDGTGRYTWDCASTCTSSTGIPEPNCTSLCFCVNPGEGFEVVTSGPASFQINGCDSFVPINIPIIGANPPPQYGSLVSVPFHTDLVTWNDLGTYYHLPSTFPRGRITTLINCGQASQNCDVGTVTCMTLLLEQGKAYRLQSPFTGTYSNTNPVACIPPNPQPAQCPIKMNTPTSCGGTCQTISWTPPDPGCGTGGPFTYEVARFDLSCLTHYCKKCASCVKLPQVTDPVNSVDDPAPPPDSGWLVRVIPDGTWNEPPGGSQCVDLDLMFAQGCL